MANSKQTKVFHKGDRVIVTLHHSTSFYRTSCLGTVVDYWSGNEWFVHLDNESSDRATTFFSDQLELVKKKP